MENNEDEINKLRIDNEIKKMKLSLEHRAKFFSNEENKLPPEIEGQWLNHIQQFEDAYKNSQRILIYDLIGKPTYKPVNEIPESELKFELTNIQNLLSEKAINIDTICEVEDRELYRFITEELLKEEVEDIMIEGMMHHFIYEEFHPNHKHDITTLCEEFVNDLLNKDKNLNPTFIAFTNEMNTKTGIIKKEDAVKKLELFREAFSSFKLKNFNITLLEIAEDTAEVCFDINYIANLEDSSDKSIFSGIGNFMLKSEYDYWNIHKISIPGVPL